jgi:hypothetical protein
VNCDPFVFEVPRAACVHAAFVYHFHLASVPREPPVTESVIELPGQTLAMEDEIPVGAIDGVFTEIILLTVEVTLQVPFA